MAEKGIVLTKNENDALPLTEEDYTGENSVALIGRYGSYYKSGVDGERSWGILEYQTSPYESMTELLGEDANIVAEVMVEPYGDVIPAECFFQDAEGTQSGLVRTYGILDEDFVESSGGDMSAMLATRLADLEAQLAEDPENESLISEIAQLEEMMAQTASSGEEEETDNTVTMEGYVTGEVYGVDANIDFNTGSERSYWNGEDGTAFEYGEVYTWKGYLQAPESSEYTFSIAQMGGTATFSIVVDGEKQTASNSTASTRNAQSGDTTLEGLVASSVSVTLEAGQMYEVVITTDNTTGYSDYYDQAVQLMWILPSQPEADLQAAYDAAASASKVVYFTTAGTNTYDMAVTDAETIKELAAITHENGGQFIVVFLNRSAFATDEGDWLQDCDAVVVAWYSGQAYGEAITNILTGEVNPSGKLSLSFPKTSEETVITYDGMEIERGGDTSQQTYTAVYSEGLDFGYRFYDSEDLEVGWAFGYGLSYTTFELSDLQVQAVDAVDEYGRDVSYEITVTVTNTGDVAGSEVVQVYVDGAQDAPEHVQVTEKQLCAFARVDDLEPGESRSVTMPVTTRMLEYWDTEMELIEREDGTSDKWVLGTGERTFMVGNSSDNLTLSEVVVVE